MVYWRIYEVSLHTAKKGNIIDLIRKIFKITKNQSRQRLKDTQRMDKILHQNQQKELTRNGLSHCEGHAIDSSEVGEDQVTL